MANPNVKIALKEEITWISEVAKVVTLTLVTAVDRVVRVGSSTVAKWNSQYVVLGLRSENWKLTLYFCGMYWICTVRSEVFTSNNLHMAYNLPLLDVLSGWQCHVTQKLPIHNGKHNKPIHISDSGIADYAIQTSSNTPYTVGR